MAMPAAIRLQKRRLCPRLSRAFRAEKMNAVVIIRSGVKSPTAVRKCGFGKMIGARAKPASRQTPPKSAEICRRDTSSHHMMFASCCLDHGMVTLGYGGNNPGPVRKVVHSARPGCRGRHNKQ